MTQDQPPSWNEPPTSEFRPVPPGQHPGYGPPPQKQGASTALIVALVLVAVLLLAILVAGAFFLAPRLTNSQAGPVTSTVSVTETASADPAEAPEPPPAQPAPPVQPARGSSPSGAYECFGSSTGPYSGAAVGTSATSCEFAASVRSEYLAAGGSGQSMTVTAYSPITGQSYTMSCAGGPIVTCSGGNNAVVHLY